MSLYKYGVANLHHSHHPQLTTHYSLFTITTHLGAKVMCWLTIPIVGRSLTGSAYRWRKHSDDESKVATAYSPMIKLSYVLYLLLGSHTILTTYRANLYKSPPPPFYAAAYDTSSYHLWLSNYRAMERWRY